MPGHGLSESKKSLDKNGNSLMFLPGKSNGTEGLVSSEDHRGVKKVEHAESEQLSIQHTHITNDAHKNPSDLKLFSPKPVRNTDCTG